MARFLVIDWDHHQLHIVSATVSGSAVRVHKAAVFTEPRDPNPAEAEALGKILRERLKEAGIAPAPVLFAIGRDRVIVKEIRHPPVPPQEEASLIRFQAIKEMATNADEVVIDYVPRGDDGRNGERRAAVVFLRKELMQTYKSISAAAGLKLVGVTPRAFGIASCLQRVAGTTVLTPAPEPKDAAVAVLVLGAEWAEFCIVRDGELQLVRSLNMPAASDNALVGEIKRNLAVHAGQAPQQPVKAFYLAGIQPRNPSEQLQESVSLPAAGIGLRDRLKDSLSVPVHGLDPFGGVEQPGLPQGNRGSFTGAVGLLYARIDPQGLPINFAQPREPRAAGAGKNRLYAAVAAGMIVASLIGVIVFCSLYLASLKRQLKMLEDEAEGMKYAVAAAEEDSKRAKAVSEWVEHEVVWLDELFDFTSRFQDIEKDTGTKDILNELRITQLTMETTNVKGSKSAGKISVKGVARENSKPVDLLIAQMVKDGSYRVDPKIMGRNTSVDRQRFVQQFTTRADVDKRPPSKYVRQLPPPPERKSKSKGKDKGGFSPEDFFNQFDPLGGLP